MKKQIQQFATALDHDELEQAKAIYESMNEHCRLDALAAVPRAQAYYFQQWLKAA